MNSRINILNELRGISPVLASLPFTRPYQDVPAGYFESLSDTILLQVKEDQKSEILAEMDKTIPYEVPQDYFQNLATIIMQRIKAGEEESTGEELKILSPLLEGLQKKNTFSVPQGYFDDLSVNAVAGAKAIEFVNEELENLSPLMAGLKGKKVYDVPAGYFDQLPRNLLNIAREQPVVVAKVIRMGTTRRVMRYAVAATVIGIVAISGWLFTGKQVSTQPNVTTPMVNVAKESFEEIKNDVSKLSDTELQSFAEEDNALFPEPITASSVDDFNEPDVKDLLADVSDEELQQYLDEDSGIKKSHSN